MGQVIELVPVSHAIEKDRYARGYSMRFGVEESLSGELGTETIIQTGSGAGDCGSPYPVGTRVLVFAYKNEKDGALWTSICSGNRVLGKRTGDAEYLEKLRKLIKQGKSTVFGNVTDVKPIWWERQVEGSDKRPTVDLPLIAEGDRFNVQTKSARDGSYEITDLPPGQYKITPQLKSGADISREYPEHYQANLAPGQCARIDFEVFPATRIKGTVTLPPGIEQQNVDVVALPVRLKQVDSLSGKSSTTENGRFDIWPLPPGDYYVGVNINSSPTEDCPFSPTYYPGVIRKSAAGVVHIEEGETKEIDITIPETAKPRSVRFTAIGLDGKPMKKIYIQLEDLRHPGDAITYHNIDLDGKGAGSLIVYAGFSYHLHASQFISNGTYWCAKPVLVSAGTKPVDVQFVMDRTMRLCQIDEIDGRSE